MSELFVAIILLATGFLFSMELRRRRLAETRLQDALTSVEQQVADRTNALSKAMAELKISEQQFRLITELSPVHLFRAGSDGQAIFLSPGFLAMTGLAREQALGFGWVDAVHPDDRDRLMLGWEEALRMRTAFQTELRFRTATSEFRWYRARVVPDRDEAGTIVGWVGAAVDLHELHLALEERASALDKAESARQVAEEASHLKDAFLATASHELRTPLNAIVGWVHVLQTGALVNEEQRANAVAAIGRNARIQTRLIEDLLDVSRMIQGRVSLTVSPINLRSVVDAAVDTIRPAVEAKDLSLAIDTAADVLPIVGDAQRLQQVIWNLLANAVKYTARGGRIDVSLEQDGERAVVRVRDNGEGIDPQFAAHIFEPFRQAAATSTRSGLGLGLAIVKSLVDLHGGTIIARSEGRGRGAEFVITLPVARGAAADATLRPGSKPDPDFDHLHVLVAEDDADSAAAVTAILRLHGCETKIAGTASECIRLTAEWPPDLLICDVGLPDDDGYGLLRRLRGLPEGEMLPAIALTAYTRPEDRAKALAAGFRAHLSKPLDPESLLREIAAAVKGRPAA